MWSLFKKRDKSAENAFEAALAASRSRFLYLELQVPDTFDGRFDSLMLHLWPVFRSARDEKAFTQALFDLTFRRMELSLRESGVGDLSVGRHVRFMMTAFYGRMGAYDACKSAEEWRDALRRNLYGTIDSPDFSVPSGMLDYARKLAALTITLDDARKGVITYPL